MFDVDNLSKEIDELDRIIESYDAELRELRQQREFKNALLCKLRGRGSDSIELPGLSQQEANVREK